MMVTLEIETTKSLRQLRSPAWWYREGLAAALLRQMSLLRAEVTVIHSRAKRCGTR